MMFSMVKAFMYVILLLLHSKMILSCLQICSWVSTEFDPPVIKWSPGSLVFATGSTELSLWVPDLSKIGSFVGGK